MTVLAIYALSALLSDGLISQQEAAAIQSMLWGSLDPHKLKRGDF